jgi:hypothetical protein
MSDLTHLSLMFGAISFRPVDEPYCRCPTCGESVDERDVEQVLQHLDPAHAQGKGATPSADSDHAAAANF